jgi:hypothetical protein
VASCFRAGLNPEPVAVSECGDAKRQSGICEGGGFAGRRLGLRHGEKLTTADQPSLLASDLPRKPK